MRILFKTISTFLFIIYLFLLLKVTLFRTSVTLFDITFSEQNGYITSLETAFARANFTPFHSIHYYLISKQEPFEVGIVNVLGNILLFIPFGFLLPLTWRRFRNIGRSVLVMLFTSIFSEVIQLFMAVGNFDVDDTILNLIGGVIGYVICALVMNLWKWKSRIDTY